eukprot:EG_transcript_32947
MSEDDFTFDDQTQAYQAVLNPSGQAGPSAAPLLAGKRASGGLHDGFSDEDEGGHPPARAQFRGDVLADELEESGRVEVGFDRTDTETESEIGDLHSSYGSVLAVPRRGPGLPIATAVQPNLVRPPQPSPAPADPSAHPVLAEPLPASAWVVAQGPEGGSHSAPTAPARQGSPRRTAPGQVA